MNHLKNIWSTLLLVLSIIFFLIIINSCVRPEQHWRYEIRGYVIYNGTKHKATWFTDTIEIGDNYLRYENTDGSEVVIPAPFILIDHKYDKVKKNYENPFR